MPEMTRDPDTFFAQGCGRCDRAGTPDCSAAHWSEGLAALRALCLGAGLDETAKWGHPCYTHAGRNVALIGAFRNDFRLSLFNAALLTDPDGLLTRAGPNSRMADTIRFTDARQVVARAGAIGAQLAQGRASAAAGRVAPKATDAPDLPEALTDALDADPDLAGAFAALTPGRQRSYGSALSSAKTRATQEARIARFRDRILAGKGATER
jgi:uncharacterized protein YdeI (YjbR/CyaY-like superfamily)